VGQKGSDLIVLGVTVVSKGSTATFIRKANKIKYSFRVFGDPFDPESQMCVSLDRSLRGSTRTYMTNKPFSAHKGGTLETPPT